MTQVTIDLNSTVGSWVVHQPALARVFERLGIDYCCGGQRTLAAACRAAGVEADRVLHELRGAVTTAPEPEHDWKSAPLGDLCRHIEGTHHAYLRTELPRLEHLFAKVIRAHAAHHPEIERLGAVYAVLKRELELHMLKEEQVLFPAIRRLEAATELPSLHGGGIDDPIGVMEHEHDHAGAALREMRALTHDYTLPAGACNTFRALYAGLAELEQDMHTHVHKENNILFPRAVLCESQLAAGARATP